VKDVFSNRIVGCSIDRQMKASLAVKALENAVALRCPVGTVVRRDRGTQFRSKKFVHAEESWTAGLDGTRRRLSR
jgi:transposase InsO family protein